MFGLGKLETGQKLTSLSLSLLCLDVFSFFIFNIEPCNPPYLHHREFLYLFLDHS